MNKSNKKIFRRSLIALCVSSAMSGPLMANISEEKQTFDLPDFAQLEQVDALEMALVMLNLIPMGDGSSEAELSADQQSNEPTEVVDQASDTPEGSIGEVSTESVQTAAAQPAVEVVAEVSPEPAQVQVQPEPVADIQPTAVAAVEAEPVSAPEPVAAPTSVAVAEPVVAPQSVVVPTAEPAPKAVNTAKPADSSKFKLDEKPSGFFGLAGTLFESEEEQDARIGKITQPESTPDLSPPTVKTYTMDDAKVAGLGNLGSRFIRDFELAKKNDPAYQAALYEFEAASISADVSGLAYTPRLAIQNRFLENERDSRTIVSITQPLFNMQLLATVQEKDSKVAAAQAQMNLREYELSERVFDAVITLIEASEQLRVNTARIQALETESVGAKREFELGSGSVTDVRDAETRLAQARAEQLKFQSSIRSASRRLFQLTGERPNPTHYTLSRNERISPVGEMEDYMGRAMNYNSELIKSRAQERLVELEVLKAKSAYIPSVDVIAARSYSDLGDIRNSGVTFGVSVPINAGTFYEASAAEARLNKARLGTREVQEKIESDLEQAYFNVTAGVHEVKARLQAIESASLSVTANEKSFKGGVRTRIDVLNSVETLYVVNQQYIRSVAELARNYLRLNNSAARPADETMAAIQQILF